MAIHDAAAVLQAFEDFLQELQRYRETLGSHEHYDEAEALRSRLSQRAGQVTPDLDELQIPRQVSWYGQTMPVIESALQPVADPDNIVVQGQMLDLAIQAMETAVGRARRLVTDREREAIAPHAEDVTRRAMEDARVGEPTVFPVLPDGGPVPRFRWFLIGLLLGAGAGYTWGRYRDEIWNFAIHAGDTWPTWKKTVVPALVGAAVIVTGILINLLTNDGVDGMKRRPVRSALMLAVALGAAIAVAILSTP